MDRGGFYSSRLLEEERDKENRQGAIEPGRERLGGGGGGEEEEDGEMRRVPQCGSACSLALSIPPRLSSLQVQRASDSMSVNDQIKHAEHGTFKTNKPPLKGALSMGAHTEVPVCLDINPNKEQEEEPRSQGTRLWRCEAGNVPMHSPEHPRPQMST
ncbi:unnamed protein product [Pleuronectes platessa]|uniref:Uncharacterized protein n=1 Tax=Pleuronectes platessa TaxID=8262 RepID=A0A9N7Z5S1_PLEPL|nr:unnamed protein product [Pleuronectes platessa]